MISIDPGEGEASCSWGYCIYYLGCEAEVIQAISPIDFVANRAIFRYTGNTSFDIYGIRWDQDGDTHYIDEFAIPRNHFYWASTSGTIDCNCYQTYFNVYNPSMTIYVDYEWREYDDVERYNGRVSPASVSNLSLNASKFSGSHDDEITVRLYWDQSIYECTLWLTNASSTHFCDNSTLDLVASNCSGSAFGVGVTNNDGNGFEIESISITDEDGTIQSVTIPACYDEQSVIVDFTTVWGGNGTNVYALGANSSSICFESASYVSDVRIVRISYIKML